MRSEPTQIDPAKVAIYIRWSTDDQGEGTTLEVQSETCRAYLLSQGWTVNPDLIFIDDGYSGGTLDRPNMARLRQAVARDEVDCVVVYKLDRLSRSVVDTVNLVCREWEGQCAIKSAREPIDTTSQAGKMFFYTLINYAEWERSVIKERTYSGKLRRAQEGKNPGMKPPYGYLIAEGGRFGIVPAEVAIVQRIYREYLAGMGMRQIVTRLNAEGIQPREATMWGQSTVQRILSNPAYIGRLEYGRRRQTGQSRTKQSATVITETSLIPPLIAREDWEMVQSIKATRPGFGRGQGSGRSSVSDSLLTGLLRCQCGHGFAGRSLSKPYRYYRCMGAHMKGAAYCDCGSIRQEALDDLVVESLRSLYGGEAVRQRLVQKIAEQYQHQLAEARATGKALQHQRQRLLDGEQRLKRLLRDGAIRVDEYRDLKDDLDRESAYLSQAEERAQQLERQALAGLQDQGRIAASLAQVDEWARLDHPGKKQLLRQFIEQIELYKAPKAASFACRIRWRWDRATLGEPPSGFPQ